MKNPVFMKKLLGIALCICLIMPATGCGILDNAMDIVSNLGQNQDDNQEDNQEDNISWEEMSELINDVEYESDTEELVEEESISDEAISSEENNNETISVTVQQKVTFEVDCDWELQDAKWGSFWDESGVYMYQVLMIYHLGEHSVDSFYKFFQSECENTADEVEVITEPEAFTTADGWDAYVGRMEMRTRELYHTMDVLIIPDKNIAVVFSVTADTQKESDTDVREITETVTIPYGNEDYVSGYTFNTNYGTTVVLDEDGRYKEYLETGNEEGAYSTGTYEIFYGDEAIEELVSMDIGFETEALNQNILTNGNGHRLGYNYAPAYLEGETVVDENAYHVCKDTFCTIVTMEEWVVDEDGTVEKGQGFYVVRVCFYLYEIDTLDVVNAYTGNVEQWYRQ